MFPFFVNSLPMLCDVAGFHLEKSKPVAGCFLCKPSIVSKAHVVHGRSSCRCSHIAGQEHGQTWSGFCEIPEVIRKMVANYLSFLYRKEIKWPLYQLTILISGYAIWLMHSVYINVRGIEIKSLYKMFGPFDSILFKKTDIIKKC